MTGPTSMQVTKTKSIVTSLVAVPWEQIDLSGLWHVDHSNKQDRPQLFE